MGDNLPEAGKNHPQHASSNGKQKAGVYQHKAKTMSGENKGNTESKWRLSLNFYLFFQIRLLFKFFHDFSRNRIIPIPVQTISIFKNIFKQ